VKLHQDFTDRLDLLDTAIRKVKKPGVQTSLYNAIWQFCNEKMRGVRGLRALVIITDGDDSVGQATLEEAIEIAQNTETVIFGISTKAGFSGVVTGVEMGQVKDKGDRTLEKLCEETGGRAFFTGDKLALERAFGRVAKELRSQYIVSYRPTNENYDGGFRRIEVKLARTRDGMKVRTRRGYRAIRRTTDAR
jgi:VWFA-related protein